MLQLCFLWQGKQQDRVNSIKLSFSIIIQSLMFIKFLTFFLLLRCLKKQLIIANGERRVGVLCFRILMAHKLLKGTNKYTLVSKEVEEAVKHLEAEFGVPITGLPSEMSRGLVNRLCCAKDVKGHCSSALKELDSLPLPSTIQGKINKHL